MSRVRTVHKNTESLEPKNPLEWNLLLKRAIAAAGIAHDRRETALRAALVGGTASQTLKRLGIICEADIRREFPTSASISK